MRKLFASFVLLFAFVFPSVQAMEIPVHTQMVRYTMGPQTPAEGLYNLDLGVNWHREPREDWGWYTQFWFWYQAGFGGYMGLQKDNEGKKAIFSIWDNGSGTKSAVPQWSACKAFGHEGSGASCIIPFNWKAGHEYTLRVWKTVEQPNPGYVRWGGWVIDMGTREETMIGLIDLKDTKGLKGYGGLESYGHGTVLEFYLGDRNATCADMPLYAVTFRGPYGNNGDVTPRQAHNTYNTGIGTQCPNTNAVSIEPMSVYQESGKGVARVTPEGTDLWSKWDVSQYVRADCAMNWAESKVAALQPRRRSAYRLGQYARDYRVMGKGSALAADTFTGNVTYMEPNGQVSNLGNINEIANMLGCR